jgi:hypothetical protein
MAAPTPPTGVGWDTTSPGIGEPHGNDYKELQELKLAVSLRLVKEHVAFSTSTAGGEHKPGSAISYFGDFSTSAAGNALPTRRPDATAPWTSGGTALTAADYGRLAYDTDAVFGGILWVYLAAGWTKVGYMDILTAQTIAGVKTFSVSPIVPTLTTGDDTTKAASTAFVQQEITASKATIFGTRTVNDSLGSALAIGSVYKAGSDGFVSYTVVRVSDTYLVTLVSDSNATPTTVLASQSGTYGADGDTVCIPIKKDDYWKINNTNGTVSNIRWLPMGSGTCVKQ